MDVVRVVDVPIGTCADEAQRILNGPCAENRYLLVQVLQLPDGSLRAIYRLLVLALDAEAREAFRKFSGNRDGKDAEALDFIRAHPELSTRGIESGLAELGIRRSKDWVSKKRRYLQESAEVPHGA